MPLSMAFFLCAQISSLTLQWSIEKPELSSKYWAWVSQWHLAARGYPDSSSLQWDPRGYRDSVYRKQRFVAQRGPQYSNRFDLDFWFCFRQRWKSKQCFSWTEDHWDKMKTSVHTICPHKPGSRPFSFCVLSQNRLKVTQMGSNEGSGRLYCKSDRFCPA